MAGVFQGVETVSGGTVNGAVINIDENGSVTAFYWYSGYPCGYHEGEHMSFSTIHHAYRWAKGQTDDVKLQIPSIDREIIELSEA